MAWKGLKLTADGQKALSAAQAAQKLKIRSIAVGDGSFTGESQELKGLVNQLYEIEELEIVVKDAVCMITAELPEKEYEYYFREIGVTVETDEGVKLYAYDNSGDDAQQVIPGTGNATVKRRVRLTLTVANIAEVTVTNPSVMYVTYDDFQDTLKNKVDVEEGKGLSANDYTDQDKKVVDGLNGLGFGQDENGSWGYKAPGSQVLVPFGADGDIEEAARFERIVIGTHSNATYEADTVLATFPENFEYKWGQVFVEIIYSAFSNWGTIKNHTTGMVFFTDQESEFKIPLEAMFFDGGRRLYLQRMATIQNARNHTEISAGAKIIVSGCSSYNFHDGTWKEGTENEIYLVPRACFLSVKNRSLRYGQDWI